MKKLVVLKACVLMLLLNGLAVLSMSDTVKAGTPASSRLEFIFFHYSKCTGDYLTIDTKTPKLLSLAFPEKYQKGMITFKSINLDNAANKALAKKYGIDKQALIVVGDSRWEDLTASAVSWVSSSVELYQTKLEQIVNKWQPGR